MYFIKKLSGNEAAKSSGCCGVEIQGGKDNQEESCCGPSRNEKESSCC